MAKILDFFSHRRPKKPTGRAIDRPGYCQDVPLSYRAVSTNKPLRVSLTRTVPDGRYG